MTLVDQKSGEERLQQSRALTQLKGALEQEIQKINSEAASLNVLRDQVKALEGRAAGSSVDNTLEAITSALHRGQLH